MTMFQHTLLGALILKLLWWVWIRHYFYTQKNIEDIENEINEWLNR